ncbi:Pyridoxal phosphate-dependent transferase [Pleurotus pulmonarius]
MVDHACGVWTMFTANSECIHRQVKRSKSPIIIVPKPPYDHLPPTGTLVWAIIYRSAPIGAEYSPGECHGLRSAALESTQTASLSALHLFKDKDTSSVHHPDVDKARAHFPALKTGYIYADNAGGSQVPQDVVNRIADYLLYSNVQLGAGYSVCAQSLRRVQEGKEVAMKLLNAASLEEIMFGGSSTANMDTLMKRMEAEGGIGSDDEIIVMAGEHEANNGLWKKLAARHGIEIKYWQATPTSRDNPFSITHKTQDLLPLISRRTRIVAFSACSNILGSIIDVKEVSRQIRRSAREHGARNLEISVDCVAYAPHRRIDVQDWDIDYCAISFYKIYGPHAAALYVRPPSLRFPSSLLANELVYGCSGILPYLLNLTPAHDIGATYDWITGHEQTLVQPLLEFLTHPDQRKRGVKVVGDEAHGPMRVPTISFIVRGPNPIDSAELAQMVNQRGGIGIRWYSYNCPSGSDEPDLKGGIARISLVHYNTIEEVRQIISILREVLYDGIP